ncbi:hypothetical protein [Streptomyces sp. SP18CS02]|uniref:hypothetical protein n=1 Tax=Streptomyces sp. SP18CS02 TaxID=3002531 RepID=UPI002E764A3B|nr:hypothetical protein [Streptomyces sp. SP18CS02]MEE1752261.1 hypothetical protein [Streptomyces sp. SP18CS02]
MEVSYNDASDFLAVLARDEKSYGLMSMAQQAYTMMVMLDHPPARDAFGKLHFADAMSVGYVGAESQGILDQARANQIVSDIDASTEQRNKDLEKSAAWTEFGVSAATGAGLAFINPPLGAGVAAVALIPWAAETAGEAVNTLISEEFGEHNDEKEKKIDPDAEKDEALDHYFTRGQKVANAPIDIYVKHYRESMSRLDEADLRESAKRARNGGYDHGALQAGRIAPGPYEVKEEDKWFGLF